MIKNDIQINTKLQRFEKVDDLPEELKYYRVVMSNKSEYTLTGDIIQRIMKADTNFIKIPKAIINKAFIMEIFLDKQLTVEKYRKKL